VQTAEKLLKIWF